MNKLKQLVDIKNKLIELTSPQKGLERLKNSKSLKGGFLKNILKYIVLKPFSMKPKSNEDYIFTGGSENNTLKGIAVGILIFNFFMSVIVSLFGGLFFGVLFGMSLFAFMECILICQFACYWYGHNSNIKKQYSEKEFEKIKSIFFEKYNKEDVDILIGNRFSKNELEKILIDIRAIVSEKEMMSCFEKMNPLENNLEITDPYVILNITQQIINTTQKENENAEILIKNKKLIDKNAEILKKITSKNKVFA